jgi:hypothetical protein
MSRCETLPGKRTRKKREQFHGPPQFKRLPEFLLPGIAKGRSFSSLTGGQSRSQSGLFLMEM